MAKSNAGQKFTAPPLRSPFFEAGTTPNSSYSGGGSGPTTKGPAAPGSDGNQQTISRQWAQWTQNITNQFNAGIPVTGSRSNGDAVNQLLTALDTLGFIKNNSTE